MILGTLILKVSLSIKYESKPFFSLFQLSWIQQILSNPGIFCFADYPCHTVVIDLLKTVPEDDNREISTW